VAEQNHERLDGYLGSARDHVRVAKRSRVEVGQDSLENRSRHRPMVNAVVQHPLGVDDHPAYDFRNSDGHGPSSRLVARASPELAAAKAMPLTSTGIVSIRDDPRRAPGEERGLIRPGDAKELLNEPDGAARGVV
jgi:hypothetical protein